jgi:hypothetical protein
MGMVDEFFGVRNQEFGSFVLLLLATIKQYDNSTIQSNN